jgi:hypothetical protein
MLRLRRRPSLIAVSSHHNRKVGEKFLTGLKSLEAEKTNVTMKPEVEFTNSICLQLFPNTSPLCQHYLKLALTHLM